MDFAAGVAPDAGITDNQPKLSGVWAGAGHGADSNPAARMPSINLATPDL